MVKIFNNQDEQGVETVNSAVGSAAKAVKNTAKSVADQFDIVSYLYGKPTQQEEQDPNEDPVIAMMKQYRGRAKASEKAGVNLNNRMIVQAMMERKQRLSKNMTPEKVEELEILRQRLRQEYLGDILQPQPSQPEESAAEKVAREEEEKKAKKQEKQVEEVKKKEALSVVQKRTSVEREKGWGAG